MKNKMKLTVSRYSQNYKWQRTNSKGTVRDCYAEFINSFDGIHFGEIWRLNL